MSVVNPVIAVDWKVRRDAQRRGVVLVLTAADGSEYGVPLTFSQANGLAEELTKAVKGPQDAPN